MPGRKRGSLPKDRRFLSRLLSGQDVQEACPARSPSSSRRKIPHQRRQRFRRDRPSPKPLCATAALIQARRAKQLSLANKESSPPLNPRTDAA
jgi:hypothetical protein